MNGPSTKDISSSAKLIIIYFGDYWETDRCRRRQQLALRLAQRPEVEKLIHVEFPTSLGELVKAAVGATDRETAARCRRVLRHGRRCLLDKIELITSFCVIPFFRFTARFDKNFAHWQSNRLIRRALKSCNAKHILLWVSQPLTIGRNIQFGESLICYDCTEKFYDFIEYSAGVRQMARENDLIFTQKADLLFVQTPAHLKEKTKINSHSYLVPNASDLELFSSEIAGQEPEDIKGIPKPILGYFGNFNSRINVKLLLKVAKGYPEGSLVLVGGVGRVADKEELIALKKMQNVHFLGEKPYAKVTAYLFHFDVCLMPYKKLEYLGSPSKMFDYLTSGKPIVTTSISGVKDFADVVNVTEDDQAFIEAIQVALQEKYNSNQANKRRAITEIHSWEAREEQVWALIQSKL